MIYEILLQPHASTHASGLETVGLMLCMLDGQEGHNLPGSVRFQVGGALHCWNFLGPLAFSDCVVRCCCWQALPCWLWDCYGRSCTTCEA